MTGPRDIDALRDQVRTLALVMEERGLSRLEVYDEAWKIVLERPVDRFAAFPAPIVLGSPPAASAPPGEGDDTDDNAEPDPADDPDGDLLFASATGVA